MTDDKFLDRQLSLLDSLHDRTRAGKVNWLETDQENWFMSESGGFFLKTGELFDPDYPESPDYVLVIMRDGREIDRISNTSLRPVSDRKNSEGHNPYVLLQRIYEMARRTALRVDDALDTLLESLKSD